MEKFESKKLEEKLTLEQINKKAEEILQEDTINPDDFIDLYGKDNIREDKEYVRKMENTFKVDSPEQLEINKLATIFEAIIYEHTELSNWFGPDAFTIKSSRYDDIKNGVDSIVEFRESDYAASYLALAIDVTFSADVEKKFERIKKEIEEGELSKIKYFVSEHMNVRGELAKIPRVVIGAESKTVKNLAELWIEEKNKDLGIHPIQFQVLEEAITQLETFKHYAEKVNRPEIAGVYHKTLNLVKKIYEEKLTEIHDAGERDKVFYAIEEKMARFI